MALQHPPLPTATRRRRVRLGIALLVSCVALIAWIVDLSISLPMRYETRGWRVAWTGFDVAELAALATTGYSALRDRWALIPASAVTATLLLCDAWFDVALATGTGDFADSVATAVLVEVPTAIVLGLVAWRLTRPRGRGAGAATGPLAAQSAASRDVTLEDDLRAILAGPSVATLATLGPDGQPHSRVVALRREGDMLLLSIMAPVRPSPELARDAQVSVSVFDLADPRSGVEIRGTAHLLADGEPAVRAALAGEQPSVPAPAPRARPAEPVEPAGVRLVARLIPTAITRLAS